MRLPPSYPAFTAVGRMLRRRWSVGITARLAVGFAAVALLAAAANLVAEHGDAVISTHRVQAVRAQPLASAVVVHRSSSPASPPMTMNVPVVRLDTKPLALAIERYHRAVAVRVVAPTAATSAELNDALQGLHNALRPLVPLLDGRSKTALESQWAALERAGTAYVDVADERRAAVTAYVGAADALNGRVAASFDRAWKIFGRVVARQSLVQLQSDMEGLRRAIAAWVAADSEVAVAADELEAREARFAATWRANEHALLRSNGEAWSADVRNGYQALLEDHHTTAEINERLRAAEQSYAAQRARLAAEMHGLRAAVHPVKHIVPAAPATLPLVDPLPMSPVLPAKRSTVDTITTSTGVDRDERRQVEWITLTVIALLLATVISTVRSFLLPVRRMLNATARIAAGDVEVRIPAGGIKELDRLAESFNRMAEQLAAARDMTKEYQHRLEDKVAQRTRQLQHLAEHDSLTQLPNRRQLFVLLNHALERAAQHRRHVAVFFIDIDNFKNLNDSKGHAFGDQVLLEIAQRIKGAAQEFGFAGRLGGDEFTVVYEDAASADVLIAAGSRLVEIFEQPFVIDGREVSVRASVGASLYPDHGERAEDLLSAADVALFHAKDKGRRQLALFTAELRETASRKFTIEQNLRLAIGNDEFELVFQPEVHSETFDVVLVESLVRWRLPDGRLALPGEFLAMTEESGLIVELGNWVLRQAVAIAAQWHHGAWPNARVAINVSPRQLLDESFVPTVLELLREFRLPPGSIELELTESVLQSGAATLEALRQLRAYDIAIALDDFGSGYSSLASLETLPLTRIKLDRSLVASIDTNPRSAAIAASLVELCRGLDLEVTVEGIERPEQWAILDRCGPVHLQGYWIARPLERDAVLDARRLIPQRLRDFVLLQSSSSSRAPRVEASSGGEAPPWAPALQAANDR